MIDVLFNCSGLLLAAIGIAFVVVELRQQSRIAKAEFIEMLAQDVDTNVMTEAMLDDGDLKEYKSSITMTQKYDLIKFLTFFERVKVICDLRVGSLELFDKLFAYRFFLLTHNQNVQNHILLSKNMSESWNSIFILHKNWADFREKNGLRNYFPAGYSTLVQHPAYRAANKLSEHRK